VSHSILIVDDSPIMRKMLRRVITMTKLDFDVVHEASNGLEALEVLSRATADVALVDINMPEMNGIELIERLAETGKLAETIVVVISTERSEARMARLAELGVSRYLTKPFRPEDLRDAVETTLAERSRS
jgi:two-component system chemotaxis response regulator CheY